jgi:FixJ family two-component response regulator
MEFVHEIEMLRRRRRAELVVPGAGSSLPDSSVGSRWGDALIAVVDDEASVGNSLARLLRSFGFRTQVFGSGEEFIRAGTSTGFGCALIDIHMPHMSGYDVLAAWQAEGRASRIVTMSACGAPETSDRALGLGSVVHLRKPIDDAVLLDAMESALSLHR